MMSAGNGVKGNYARKCNAGSGLDVERDAARMRWRWRK
jgi:hypothetical protein